MSNFSLMVLESIKTTKKVKTLPNGGWIEFDGRDYQYFNAAGEFHREDGPSFCNHSDEIEIWEQHNKYHRVDGPAYIDHKMNVKKWFFNGKPHRDGGPAYISDTLEVWYLHGKRHRTDGPAYITSNGGVSYYVNDKQLTEKEFLKHFSIS